MGLGGLGEEDYQEKQTILAVNAVDILLPKIDSLKEGFWGAAKTYVWKTPEYDFAQSLKQLQAEIGFGSLQEMRNASKTGGALGNVSDREGEFLQAVLGTLDAKMSKEALKENLNQVKNILINWEKIKQVYGVKYGVGGTGGQSIDYSQGDK